ncbi:lipopolysaccharide biosynthesis protein [Microbacterium sp. HA-8]|uniref:lipopolysaccharide biosynthesis protein n=1 Tax=Microbacterium sp. HA-8 TaxID=3234200 RepID=UPI0038F7C150
MTAPSPLWRRLAGFTMLPAIAAISPLLVLPAVSRSAGPDGWASAIAGEAVGTFAAIAIAYGWTTIGPALVAIAPDDPSRGTLYREALVVRLLTAVIALPLMAVVCVLVASPGWELLAVLMGLQGALIALSFTWFAVGIGSPGAIAAFDALPRLGIAIVAAIAIAAQGPVELYPAAGIVVTLAGTALYTRRVLRRYRGQWPSPSRIPSLFRTGAPVALNDAALGAYSAVPTPLVNVLSPGVAAAGFASADKLLKLGTFLPYTLANALQSWSAEVSGPARARRLKIALTAHGGFGIAGWVVLGSAGALVSGVLFGEQAAATTDVVIVLGFAFALFSLRTSMTRHVLFPAGRARTVMTATLVGTVVGVPAMILLTMAIGPVGAAIGYALTELISTALLARPTIGSVKAVASTTESPS